MQSRKKSDPIRIVAQKYLLLKYDKHESTTTLYRWFN